LNTLAAITEKKVDFRSLGDAWADTTTAHGRLMLTVLSGLAEFERELISIRTGEGRARAKQTGEASAESPSSSRTSRTRRSSAAITANPSGRLPVATMSTRARFHG
jgi:DNA invertase Pin-like site-specific DNA recombinase